MIRSHSQNDPMMQKRKGTSDRICVENKRRSGFRASMAAATSAVPFPKWLRKKKKTMSTTAPPHMSVAAFAAGTLHGHNAATGERRSGYRGALKT
jgi:hypothetical protein